jgi:hypothetical protein
MTLRWATRDTHEREEDEAERLVRPAPKVKPPRHDRRRNTIEPEDDSDEEGDGDLSLNFKTIGGSVAQRVVQRFATEWVRVRNRDKDHVTRVTPETLKEQPDLYEKVPENEPHEHRGIRPSRRPAKPKKPLYHKEHLPHPEWPEKRPLPPKPLQPPKQVRPVKPVPVPEPPAPEHEPKPKPPGWVWHRREAIVQRFLEAKASPSAPSGDPRSKKRRLKPAPEEKPGKKVLVRKKDTGWVGEVSEETLKENSAAYEKVEPSEAKPSADQSTDRKSVV